MQTTCPLDDRSDARRCSPRRGAFADTVALKANLQPSSEVPPRVSKGHGIARRDLRHRHQDAHLDRDLRGIVRPGRRWRISTAPRRSGRTRKCRCRSTKSAREPDERTGHADGSAGHRSDGRPVVLQHPHAGESDRRDSRSGNAGELTRRERRIDPTMSWQSALRLAGSCAAHAPARARSQYSTSNARAGLCITSHLVAARAERLAARTARRATKTHLRGEWLARPTTRTRTPFSICMAAAITSARRAVIARSRSRLPRAPMRAFFRSITAWRPSTAFPRALDDAVAAYRRLLADGVPAQSIVDSGRFGRRRPRARDAARIARRRRSAYPRRASCFRRGRISPAAARRCGRTKAAIRCFTARCFPRGAGSIWVKPMRAIPAHRRYMASSKVCRRC